MFRFLLFLGIILATNIYADSYRLIRFYPETEAEIKKIELLSGEFSGFKSNTNSYDLIFNDYDYRQIDKINIRYEIIINNLEEHYSVSLSKNKIPEELQSGEYFRTGSMGGYFKLVEVFSELDRMMVRYPDLISKNLEGLSNENRLINSYCIGNRACYSDNDYPQILITGMHHSRESGSIFTILYYLWDLLERADKGDELALYILRNRHIFVLPVLNPDGMIYNELTHPNGGGLWRKNRRISSDSSFGVDLNRNYGPEYAWNSPNNGSSTNVNSDTYRGLSPFSEPETQSVRNFLNGKSIRIGVNFHTFGNVVLYPFSYLIAESPDSLWYRNFLNENFRNNRYLFGIDDDLLNYTTRGSADDYFYIGDDGFDGFLSMTYEIGNSIDGFWPPLQTTMESAENSVKFLDNLILSSGKNIAIADKDAIQINGKYYLKLNIANIGYEELNSFQINVSSLDGKAYIIDDDINAGPIKRGDTTTVLVEYTPKDVENGDIAEFELTTNFDYTKKIDFQLQIYDYEEIDMFDYKNDVYLDGDWHFATDEQNKLILKSNYNNEYKPDINTNAIFVLPPHQSDSVLRYSLHFEHSYEIEHNYDFGLIFTKNTNNEIRNPNFGEYLIKGRTRLGSVQQDSLYGFQGFIKYWLPQTIYLTDSIDALKEFAFNLRTDKGSNRSGWKIKNLKLRLFTKKSSSKIEKSEILPIRLAQNPINNSLVSLISDQSYYNVNISIIDVCGRICDIDNMNILNGLNIFSAQFLSTGRYIMIIRNETNVIHLPLQIIN